MLIIANWKAYVYDLAKAKKLFAAGKKLTKENKTNIVLAPPAPFLSMLTVRNKSRVAFAAQDVSATTGGAHTGEATAQAYASAGATYAIIGHSERRLPAQAGAGGDTYAIIAEKLSHALAHELVPILCVGEHERDGEGRYLSFIREELTSAIGSLPAKERAKVIVAYEPLWAIGKTADSAITPNDLAEMVLYIRKVLAELLPGKNAVHSFVLYGGSVELSNIRDLARSSTVDGFLIGHASVDPKNFIQLVRELA